ncbi:MAG: hypothetical protein ACXWT1_02240 [Methylobacter sp.]
MDKLINSSNEDIDSQCKQLGQILGLDAPVSQAVFLAALEDEDYARNLLVASRSAEFLNVLLANPPDVAIKGKDTIAGGDFSNGELIRKAAKALSNWAKTGFSIVTNDTLEIREDACLSCSNLINPSKILQKIIPKSKNRTSKVGERTGNRVCKLCGCNVSKKIRLPSESCPDQHPDNKEQNRWGEVYQSTGGLGEVKL